MTTPTYGDLVDRYLADPSPTTLAALRRAVRAAPGFDPGLDPGRFAPLLAGGRDEEAASTLSALMPGALLSPSVHSGLAVVLRRLGHTAAASREQALALAAIQGIVATGDGTAARPWSVLRVSDEHDVLRSLGRRPVAQALVTSGGRSLDRIECADGSEAWFDATELVASGG